MATPRLKEKYHAEIIPSLKEKFQYKSVMQVPKIEKICINKGVGAAVADKKLVDVALEEITTISGQKAVPTKSKKDISNFKLRANMPIGVRVTLRGDRMYEFFDRLVNVALPRVRDFRGVSTKSFDGRGNYTLGVKDQLIFPEIDYAKVDKTKGMNVTITTQSYELLRSTRRDRASPPRRRPRRRPPAPRRR